MKFSIVFVTRKNGIYYLKQIDHDADEVLRIINICFSPRTEIAS